VKVEFLESMAGKAGDVHEIYQDATPFSFQESGDKTSVEYFGEQLQAAEYNYYGLIDQAKVRLICRSPKCRAHVGNEGSDDNMGPISCRMSTDTLSMNWLL
jgi:hypothetical protein